MIIDNVLKSQAFKLKGRLFTFTVIQLLDVDKAAFSQQIVEMVNQAPKLFENSSVVLDCSQVDVEILDLNWVYDCIRAQGIVPVAIQGGNAVVNRSAQALGLAVLNASSSHDKVLMETAFETAQTPQDSRVALVKAKRVNGPIRSGQQVVSKGADLVITGSVSYGAEILSEGHIHIYGALRGKALAGIAGDQGASIFCQSLDAELVSIAGFYLVRDAMEQYTGPCHIFLQDDQIKIQPL